MKMSVECFTAVEANQVLQIFKKGIKNKTEGISMPLNQYYALIWTAAHNLTPSF